MSAITHPNLYIKPKGNLQESVSVRRLKLEKKMLQESKDLRERVTVEDELYSDPHENS